MVGKQPKRKPRPGMDEYGRTPLHCAVIAHDVANVRDLLASGASPSSQDDNGCTPLHLAAQAYLPEVAALLIQHGAAVDAQDTNGNTPLARAVFDSRGRGDLIALLRRAGADSTRANAHGVSPLSLARAIGNYDVKQFFADLP
jgi:ankyrin repeat protein